MIDSPTLYEGQWLTESDTNEIVINQRIQAIDPHLKSGDTIPIRINGNDYPFLIVGVLEELVGPPYAYVSSDSLDKIYDLDGYATTLAIVAETDKVNEVAKTLEAKFDSEGLRIRNLLKIDEYKKKPLKIICSLLHFS